MKQDRIYSRRKQSIEYGMTIKVKREDNNSTCVPASMKFFCSSVRGTNRLGTHSGTVIVLFLPSRNIYKGGCVYMRENEREGGREGVCV